MRALRTAALVVGGVALIATGVGAAIGSAGLIAGVSGATLSTIGTLAGVAAGVGSLALAVASSNPKLLGTAISFTIDKNSGIPVVFGRTLSAGRVVHRQYYGAKNALESWVSAHSIGPVRSLGPLLLNRVATSFSAGAAVGAYAGHMWLDEQVGRCPETRALAGPQGDFPGWSAAHKLSGIAADLWTLKFDPKGKVYPNGVPQRGRVIEGVFAWDPRQDGTYAGGGSGPCRLADPATHIYTENPWILALQWALGFFQNGVLVAGGGLPVDGIDVAAFVDAALYADMVGWKAGGVAFTDTDNSWDVLKMLAQAGGGEPVTVGGMLSCTFSSPKVAIGTITSNDICGDIDVPGTASRRARRNTVIPKVRLETHGWEMTPLDSLQSADYVAVDGGVRPMEIEFPMVQQVDQGAQLGLYAMVNGRELDGIVLPCKVYALGYRPGDCLTVDIPEAALQRDVVVRHREIEGSTMAVTLTCRSETHAKHAFCLGKTGTAPPTPDLSVPPSYPVEADRAAYLIVRQSIAYPVDSTADTIAVAAFNATIDDGRQLSFPAQTIGGLEAASTYIVLWDLQASAFVAVSAPALAEVASNRYVIVRETTTANADGTYPTTPTAPGGDGGGGFGSGGCPIVTARILLANTARTGAGDTIEAGRIEAGMWVWAQREDEAGSAKWGAYQVTFARTFPSPLCAVGDRPLTSPSHLWWDGGWVRSDTIGTAAGEGKVVALTVADAATYVLVDDAGRWWLSHNKRAEQELA